MDEIQYDVDDGPCLTALRHGVTVAVPDIAGDKRWPAFSRRGCAEGAGCSLSVPLRIQGGTIGALNFYGHAPHSLTEQDEARAIRFTEQAAGAVALAVRISDHEERNRHLEAALTSRTTIDQALGILMGQRHIPADEAFTVLRELSQRANVKLRDVAAALISEAVGERARAGREHPSG
jgi:GAF domain-containing protein